MLTRRQALQVLLASPAIRFKTAAKPFVYFANPALGSPAISLPALAPGQSLTFTIHHEDGTVTTDTRPWRGAEGGQLC